MGKRQYAKHRSRYYTKGTGNEFTVAMEEMLADYTGYVQEVASSEFRKISKECVDRLKENSPRNTGYYAQHWRVKKRETVKGVADFVVYNEDYQLTHLLENGHETRNGGRTEPQVHIAPVARWAQAEVVQEIKSKLNTGSST